MSYAAYILMLAAGTGQGDDMINLGALIPEGFESRNVVIPSFKEGKLASKLTALTMVRIDEKHLDAKQVVAEIKGKSAAEDILVVMPTATYDMHQKVLRSGERSRVSRLDFEMEGDTLVFDTNSSSGAMNGRVRTLIFDMELLQRQSDESKTSSGL